MPRTPHVFTTEMTLERPVDTVFPFFSDAHNLEAITPPWLNFRVLTPAPIDMRAGTLIDYRIRIRGVWVTWRTRIAVWEPPYRFVDEQLKGPYVRWYHEHTFEAVTLPDGRPGTLCRDRVEHLSPGGPLEPLVNAVFVKRDVARIFAYRSQKLRELLPPLRAGEPERGPARGAAAMAGVAG
jgi:ligand-binding SRPBCC domain-containing protein